MNHEASLVKIPQLVLQRATLHERRTRGQPLLGLSSESSGQFLIHVLAMVDGHQANHPRFAIDGVADWKAADAIFPQPIELTRERISSFRVLCNGTNRSFAGTFQVGMERSEDLSHMRRDIRMERTHAVRRFLTGVNGSPNTSSNVSPFLPDR